VPYEWANKLRLVAVCCTWSPFVAARCSLRKGILRLMTTARAGAKRLRAVPYFLYPANTARIKPSP
jgi:hypothetical protein